MPLGAFASLMVSGWNVLDRTFVSTVVSAASPSVVLVQPTGVRNTTSQGSGFAIRVEGEKAPLKY